MKARFWLLPCVLVGCASRQTMPGTIGETRDLPTEKAAPAKPGEPPVSKLDPEIVERSAMPFYGLRTQDGEHLAPEQLLRELSKADLVCVGEDHENPHHHWAELRVLRGLIAQAPMGGRQIGIGLEMFQRTYQNVLDKYAKWEIDEKELIKQTEWHHRWGYDWAFYRPVVSLGRRARLEVLALNSPSEITTKLAHGGLEALDADQRKHLPDLDMTDSAHRAWFDDATHDHPQPTAGRDNMYLVQVVWDETMAEAASKWLSGHLPARQLLVLAGAGHCQDAAIPSRVKRRVTARIASVRPLIQAHGTDAVKPETGFDYAFVMTPNGS